MTKLQSIPELEGVAKTEDISALDEKVQKCYSEDRYQKFQQDVESIVLKTMGHEEGRDKIKAYGKEAAKDYIEENNWKNKTLWLPIIISLLGIIISGAIVWFKK